LGSRSKKGCNPSLRLGFPLQKRVFWSSRGGAEAQPKVYPSRSPAQGLPKPKPSPRSTQAEAQPKVFPSRRLGKPWVRKGKERKGKERKKIIKMVLWKVPTFFMSWVIARLGLLKQSFTANIMA